MGYRIPPRRRKETCGYSIFHNGECVPLVIRWNNLLCDHSHCFTLLVCGNLLSKPLNQTHLFVTFISLCRSMHSNQSSTIMGKPVRENPQSWAQYLSDVSRRLTNKTGSTNPVFLSGSDQDLILVSTPHIQSGGKSIHQVCISLFFATRQFTP